MATKKNTNVNGYEYFRLRRKIGEKDGKSVFKSFYGTSKSDAEKKYIEWKQAQVRQKYEAEISDDLSTFSERADQFIKSTLKPSEKYAEGSKTRYISAYRTHIENSPLSKLPVSRIKASDIQEFYNDLDVSQQTIRQVNKFMVVFYKWLVKNNYALNVLDAVELPKKRDGARHEDIVIWSEEEIETITDNLGDFRLRFLIYILLYTGARIGEASALKYSDFENDTLHIRRQWYLGEIKPPKYNSSRDIPLHEIIKKELPRHREWHEAEMKKNNYKTDYIFTTRSGNLLNSKNCSRALNRYYKRIGIDGKHTHAYRSTFCTQLCKCGVPLEVASKILGHSNIAVTAKHYALVQPETKQDAIRMLHY